MKLIRWFSWIVIAILFLFFLLVLSLRIPSVQNAITQKAIAYLKDKIKTEVRLESIFISFPKKIVLKNLYLEDQSKDTLLFAGELSIDTDLWALLQKKIELNTIEITECRANMSRDSVGGLFNFNYIIVAFADTVTEVRQDTASSSWEFTVEDVAVKKTHVTYQDSYSGNDIRVQVGELDLRMEEFDPGKMLFSIASFELMNSKIKIVQNSGIEEPDTSSQLPNISLTDFYLKDIQFEFSNLESKQHILSNIDEFKIETNNINLRDKVIDVESLHLINSGFSYEQKKKYQKIEKQDSSSIKLNIPWKVNFDEIKLTNNHLKYDNDNSPPVNQPIDFNHLDILQVEFQGKDLTLDGNNVKATVEKFSLSEKKGLDIQSLVTKMELTEHQLTINKFELRSANSKIIMKGRASFPSLDRYKQSIFNLTIKPSVITISDLLRFSPTLLDSIPITINPSTTATIESEIAGTIDNLIISKFHIKTLDSTTILLLGKVKGLTNTENAFADIELKKFRTTRTDIESILNDSLLPATIQLPEWFELVGKYKGKIKAPTVQALLTSNRGNLQASGSLNFNSNPSYDVILKTEQLQLGEILNQPDMGKLSMHATIKGSGFRMDTINTSINLKATDFYFHQYHYKDFELNGTIHKYLFSGSASLHDENLDFTLKGDLDSQKENSLYTFTLALSNADFQKLNLSARPLRARGTVDLKLTTPDFEALNGTLAIRKVAIFNGESLYTVDSLLFASINQEGENSMTIQSDILSGEFKGSFNLFKIGGVLKQHVNQYFALHDNAVTNFKTPQHFKFSLTVKNTNLITDILIPELETFIPGKIEGEFDSETNKLKMEIGFSQIKYSTTSIDSIALFVNSDDKALRYKLRVKDIKFDTLQIDAAQIIGKVEHNSIHTLFQILNSKSEEKYALGGVLKSREEVFRFQFLQDQLRLNYTKWTTPPDNYLDISNRGIIAHNFSIRGGEEKVALVTTAKDSTISIEFEKFQLSSIMRLVRGVMPANGALNGNLKFTTSNRGKFNSRIRIDNLEILEKPFGTVTLELSHANQQYGVSLQIKDSITNVFIGGTYIEKEKQSQFDLSVKLAPLNLQLIEPISFGQVKNVKGIATGNLKLTGSMKEPSIRGDLTFEKASFKSTYLNSVFTLSNEKISFEKEGISLNRVTIRDSKKNEAVINGSILTTDYKEFRFNLNVTAKNFLVMNTTEDDNDLYYGKVRINTNTKITGNSNRPRVDMNVSFSKGSEFTYVIPQRQKTVIEQEGIVKFVDRDAANDPFLKNLTLIDTIQSVFSGINLTSTLELTDQEILNIVIDPIAGDKLSVKGNANLTFSMSASGNMDLSGRYEVTQGTYELSFYKFIKRKFNIEKGGTITWAGNPFLATLDLRASYRVETSPYDLIASQLNTNDQAQLNSYRQRMPFLVFLQLEGQMLAPQVSFKLDMPSDKRGAFGGAIYAKINDINSRESDVNKQVFSLLILKRFVSENPLDSKSGNNLASTTRTSASRLLSDQLNRLSENIKGLELSFDIKSYEDFSAGEAQGDTQVQLGISKSLFHDRLVVKLSGNVDVEGESNQQERATDYIGDMALEYKLTSDGRFRITGFRTGNYDMIDGELTETGVGLIYIKDYNTFRELFKGNGKKK